MDSLFEQLYKRKKNGKDRIIQLCIFVLTVLIAMAVFFLFSIFLPGFGILGVSFGRVLGSLGIIGCVYFGYKIFMKLDIEYEYIYLSGELDVDKILSRSTRTRIVTVRCDKVERFGEYTDAAREKLSAEHFDKRFNFSSNTGKKLYYLVFQHKEYRKTLMIFEPEERILNDMKRFMKNVQG